MAGGGDLQIDEENGRGEVGDSGKACEAFDEETGTKWLCFT